MNVLTVSGTSLKSLQALLQKYQLNLKLVPDEENIPGSYWGDSEAGLIGSNVYVRLDTPIHSLLHEACHYVCMDSIRRKNLDTNAEGDYDEENGVCYLQILLSDEIEKMGRARMLDDMDEWGYTFRLGSSKRWFEEDAEDAKQWLIDNKVIDSSKKVTFSLRM